LVVTEAGFAFRMPQSTVGAEHKSGAGATMQLRVKQLKKPFGPTEKPLNGGFCKKT
jgi:hypothetical protein